jgi:hypothetical protein
MTEVYENTGYSAETRKLALPQRNDYVRHNSETRIDVPSSIKHKYSVSFMHEVQLGYRT